MHNTTFLLLTSMEDITSSHETFYGLYVTQITQLRPIFLTSARINRTHIRAATNFNPQTNWSLHETMEEETEFNVGLYSDMNVTDSSRNDY